MCDAAHLQQSGRAAWNDTQIRLAVDLPPAEVSRRVRRDQEDDGPQTGGHVNKLRLPLMYYVTEYGVHPFCTMNMDETAAKLLGLGHCGWVTPKQDGRMRFVGAADKRSLTISTVVTMTGTIMAFRARRHESSGAGPATEREYFLHLSARATGAPRAHARS